MSNNTPYVNHHITPDPDSHPIFGHPIPADTAERHSFSGLVSIYEVQENIMVDDAKVSITLDTNSKYPQGACISIGGHKNGYLVLTDQNGAANLILDGKGKFTINHSSSDGKHNILTMGSLGDIDGQGIILKNSIGQETIKFNAITGEVIIHNGASNEVFNFNADNADLSIGNQTKPGVIGIRGKSGKKSIELNGNTGDITLTGADCAEDFLIAETSEVLPGTVLVINNEGILSPCNHPYDKKVAGVVSGAGGVNPGVILGRTEHDAKKLPIALAGKVFCRADAKYAPIEVGDLLTTSPTCGHAMKADNTSEAFGSVIGKALQPLKSGSGIIPILVALQ